MSLPLRLDAIELPGHHLKITSPELPEGTHVEVIVPLPAGLHPRFRSALELLDSRPR